MMTSSQVLAREGVSAWVRDATGVHALPADAIGRQEGWPLGPDRLLWLDLAHPTRDVLDALSAAFDLHGLAVEDCLHVGQRPKFEVYDGHVFMVMHHPHGIDRGRDRVQLGEIETFVGPGWLITTHQGALEVMDEVRARWAISPDALTCGMPHLAYMLLDTVVDAYFPVLDHFEDRLADLDEEVFVRTDERLLMRVFRLKRELLALRRLVGPLRDAVLLFIRREGADVSRTTQTHLQDVYDHLVRLADHMDLFRDLAMGVQDAHLSMLANRTNDTMKRLTALSTALMTATLIAAIYGMNFDRMPELHWPWGYPWALALMVVVTGVVLGLFRWRKYL
ncbi:MAG: magnesium/cobalt transporter CorA [Candidatus Sericytochromatia bacterium]|nr:magnesium/cobalt transporter CorA [Candidatus Tanganyikabacteria bacterium]